MLLFLPREKHAFGDSGSQSGKLPPLKSHRRLILERSGKLCAFPLGSSLSKIFQNLSHVWV